MRLQYQEHEIFHAILAKDAKKATFLGVNPDKNWGIWSKKRHIYRYKPFPISYTNLRIIYTIFMGLGSTIYENACLFDLLMI